jgi:hypothetical protein
MTEQLGSLPVGVRQVGLRRATQADLPALVRLLADDPLGGRREVVTDDATDVVATLQLSFIPGLSRGARFGPRSRRSAFGPTTGTWGSARRCSGGRSRRPGGVAARSCS